MNIEESLYRTIRASMPIPCVDLVVVAPENDEVLLVLRKNEPAAGKWWFPGGRVHFSESRHNAAKRKLREECGLSPQSLTDLGTFDVFLPYPNETKLSHGITTLYAVLVEKTAARLCGQSEDYRWRPAKEWLAEPMAAFVETGLRRFLEWKEKS